MKKIAICVAALLLTTTTLPVLADEEDYIKYRQYVMKSLSVNLKASGMILKGKVEGDINGHAAAIANDSARVAHLFPEGSDFGDTDAKAKIWEQPEKFTNKADNLEKAAMAFTENPSKETFKDLGKTCKSCHRTFREK